MNSDIRKAGLIVLVCAIIGISVCGCKKKEPQETEPQQVEKVTDLARTSVDYYNRGKAYFDKGEHNQAISNFTKAIEINRVYAEAYYYRGNAYTAKDQYDRAILDYTKVLELKPTDAKAYYNRGVIYSKKSEYDRAISDYTRAIAINPRDAMAYNNRGVDYYHKKEYDRAWKDVYKIQSLGSQVHPVFLQALREASGRER